MSDLTTFNKLLEDHGLGEDLDKTQKSFATLSAALAKLPRITREFLVMLIERRETERRQRFGGDDYIELNADKLIRISRCPDNDGELRVLDSYGFVRFDEPSEHGESAYWRIFLPGLALEGFLVLLEHVETIGIPLSRPLAALDKQAAGYPSRDPGARHRSRLRRQSWSGHRARQQNGGSTCHHLPARHVSAPTTTAAGHNDLEISC